MFDLSFVDKLPANYQLVLGIVFTIASVAAAYFAARKKDRSDPSDEAADLKAQLADQAIRAVIESKFGAVLRDIESKINKLYRHMDQGDAQVRQDFGQAIEAQRAASNGELQKQESDFKAQCGDMEQRLRAVEATCNRLEARGRRPSRGK
jgi:hypothetical protein